jgi:hypothetical protein
MPEKYPQGYKNSPPYYLHEIPRGLRDVAGPIASARDTVNGCASSTATNSSSSGSDSSSSNGDSEMHPPLSLPSSKRTSKARSKHSSKSRNNSLTPPDPTHTSKETDTGPTIVVAWGPNTMVIPSLSNSSNNPAKQQEDIEVLTNAGSISQQSTISVVEDEWEIRETCTTWIRFRTWVAFPKDHGLSGEEINYLKQASQASKRQTPVGLKKGKAKEMGSKKMKEKQKGKEKEEGMPTGDIKTPTEHGLDPEVSLKPKISNLVPLANTPAAERLKKLLADLRRVNVKAPVAQPRPWSERNGFVTVAEAEGEHGSEGDAEIGEVEREGEKEKSMTAKELLEQFKLEIAELLEGPEEGSDGWGREGRGWVAEEVVDGIGKEKGKGRGARKDAGRAAERTNEDEGGDADDEDDFSEGDAEDDDSESSSEDSDALSSSSSSSSSTKARKRPVKKTQKNTKKRVRDLKTEGLELLLKGMLAQLKMLEGGG